MYPQNSYYFQQSPLPSYYTTQIQQQSQPALKGRPVSSFEEARAMTIDFDGSTFFFPDTANKRIYTKQINKLHMNKLLIRRDKLQIAYFKAYGLQDIKF